MRKELAREDMIWIISPFERPDTTLLCAAAKAGAYPVLHVGRNPRIAQEAVDEMDSKLAVFGVCLADDVDWEMTLPDTVSRIILPWGARQPQASGAEIVWQVRTPDEAMDALTTSPRTLVIKGCESGGVVGDDSAFILFQQVMPLCLEAGVSVYVQGGVGVHTASAYVALGASGVVLDSQMALFPECSLPPDGKKALRRISGPEIRTCGRFRYYIPPGAEQVEEPGTFDDLTAQLAGGSGPILPLGQDVILSAGLLEEHKRIKIVVQVLKRGFITHVKQARISDCFSSKGAAAQALGTEYPIVQGPMARVSDVPEFLGDIARGGAVPFLAMGMEEGHTARDMLAAAASSLRGKPWGAGILGFANPRILTEQTQHILENKPSYVLIAGGRPGQEKVFEKAGIKVLMHAPTPGTLDLLIKSGASRFVFEGRESGGHVGPLFSTVLWEKQIDTLLGTQDPSEFLVLFAGGIHDAFSAAFVRVMAAPLTARGVKVGFQCGTAYLYTQEAVTSGAITATYQDLLLKSNRTCLLESAFGQETHCIPSPFTEMFEQEKARMEKEGLPPAEIQNKLELLNLGRLRVASKGIGSADGKSVPLSSSQQYERGLFMTGSVCELTDATTTIAQVHKRLVGDSWQVVSDIALPDDRSAAPGQPDIAIIGMAGIFPGAEDLDEFWRNIVFGKDCITEVPPERWSTDIFFDPYTKDNEHTISKWGGFIGTSDFNALEFGISPESVTHVEPVQLLALLVAKRALEDAGLTDPANPDFEETSVFFGVDGAGELLKTTTVRTVLTEILGKKLPADLDAMLPRMTEDEFPGFLTNITAGRISNRLNTCGRNYAVDAACAASLAALDAAIAELRTNRAEMAIVGGADLHNRIDDFLGFNSLGVLSPTGRCATFDADADGLVISEGVCAVILRRLDDARRDGNTIYAVIKGIGGSSDGKNLGLTAPSKKGQILALQRAYDDAGVRPADVGLIEAHGTGTTLGDWTEVAALTQFFLEDGARPGRTELSSLKSVIGHTKTAAGLAGVITAALCVRHGVLPPTLHVRKLNKVFTPGTPFSLRVDKAGYWHGDRRIAGVSAFGFGGTNYHAILQNYETGIPEAPLASWPSELFVFPGAMPREAEALMDKVAEMLTLNDKLRLIDIAYSLSLRSIATTVQYAIVAGTRDELLTRMSRAREGTVDENIRRLTPVPGKVAFLFPGQGSQRVNMAADLFTVFPRMRRLLGGNPELERVLFPPSAFTDGEKKLQRRTITDTRNAQPVMGIVDVAMAGLLRDLGITPDVVAGHSYGELPALCFAGVIAPEDLAGLSRKRAEAILASIKDEKGRMAAVLTDEDTLSDLLTGIDDVWPVNFNAPRQIAVAGTDSGMEAFLDKARKTGVTCKELNTDCAFHSPLLQGADSRFAGVMTGLTLHQPTVAVMSNTDAGFYPPDEDGIKERLAKHLVNPVRFAEEILAMDADDVAVYIEAGPGGSLTSFVSDTLKGTDSVCIRLEDGSRNGLTFFLQGLATYISTGRMIKMSELFRGRGAEALYIEDPQTLKKEGLIFTINGQCAIPEGGGPSTIRQELSEWFDNALFTNGSAPYAVGDPGAERVVLSYMNNMGSLITNMGGLIDNMNSLIHDQRDAVLGYLGASGPPSRRIAPENDPVIGQPPVTTDAEGPVGDEPPSLTPMSTEQVTELMFDIVSGKTGYPTSMLSLDTDLEADLSIDSIKKMEIVSDLGHRLGMPADSEAMETSFEKIISIKTFQDLATWIGDVINGENGAGSDDAGEEGETGGGRTASLPSARLTRIVLTEKACPLAETHPELIRGKSFALTQDGGGLAARAVEKLTTMGADATIVDAEADLTGFDGLILINSSRGRRYSVLDLFAMIKRADMGKLRWILALDDSSGACLRSTAPHPGVSGGYSGFLKSLMLEYDGKRFCAVRFETLFDPATFAGMVADELTAAEPRTEVFYRDGDRFVLVLDKQGLARDGGTRKVLDPDSVVLVLGGAQGITPHIVRRLAEDTPCLYVLVGRSAPEPPDEAYEGCETLDDIKSVLIREEGMDDPREINAAARRIAKSTRIAGALSLIGATGATAVYTSADVTDPESFGALIDRVRTEHGRIDGVIHAAGVLEDKLFRDKTPDSFARVYNTKAVPLGIIADKLFPSLKLLVFFSSIVADVGNAGQCDYAAGNAALDDAARLYSRLYPGMRVVAVDWGPWRGAGMVSAEVERRTARRGMGFIELDRGADFFTDELGYGSDAVVVALSVSDSTLESFMGTRGE